MPPLAARKSSPKIDLRPGPIKLNSTGKTLSEVNLSDKLVRNEALQGKTQIPVVQERKGESEALEERKPSNVLQTAKSDIENAMRHGVMKPPPEGAGRIQLLWHQLKELFVSPLVRMLIFQITYFILQEILYRWYQTYLCSSTAGEENQRPSEGWWRTDFSLGAPIFKYSSC